jgi:hypothetical protein
VVVSGERGLVSAMRFSQHYDSVVARLEPHQGSVVWAEVWFVVSVSENLQHVRSLTHLAEQQLNLSRQSLIFFRRRLTHLLRSLTHR